MNTRFTLCAAALAMLGGIATAQTADTAATPATAAAAVTTGTQTGTPITTMTATEANAQFAGRPRSGRRVMPGSSGPFRRLAVAERLEGLTDEQKEKIRQFREENEQRAEELQREFRETMNVTRETTGTRENRREAMQSVREKFHEANEQVDKFLADVLTEEQMSTLREQTQPVRDGGADRIRQLRDRRTTGTAPADGGRRWRDRERQGERRRGGRDNRLENRNEQRELMRQMRQRRNDGQTTPATALDGANAAPGNTAAPATE